MHTLMQHGSFDAGDDLTTNETLHPSMTMSHCSCSFFKKNGLVVHVCRVILLNCIAR